MAGYPRGSPNSRGAGRIGWLACLVVLFLIVALAWWSFGNRLNVTGTDGGTTPGAQTTIAI